MPDFGAWFCPFLVVWIRVRYPTSLSHNFKMGKIVPKLWGSCEG